MSCNECYETEQKIQIIKMLAKEELARDDGYADEYWNLLQDLVDDCDDAMMGHTILE